MTINIFILKGDLNGEKRSVAFLFLSGIYAAGKRFYSAGSRWTHRLTIFHCLFEGKNVNSTLEWG